MRNVLAVVVLVLMCGLPLRADVTATASIVMDDVMAKKLLPIVGARGYGFPSFKFFEHNQLAGLLYGAPTANRTLASALHAIPANYTNPTLKDELATLHLSAPASEKTVLIYTMNTGCPPCDDIIRKVKDQLPDVGWGQAQIFSVNVLNPIN